MHGGLDVREQVIGLEGPEHDHIGMKLGGLGHLGLGNVDVGLLLALLGGSIPGILVGARLAGLAPEWLLRPLLAITLCYAAWALFNKG